MQLILGDCLEELKKIADNSVDSCVTDPPYGLEFMGKEWDSFKSDRRQQFDGTLPDSDVNPFRRSKVRNGNGRSYGADHRHMKAFQDSMTPIFTEILRVLKPGGHLLSFGGSRTYHRMACAVEDAGFEIRDQIMWIYGSGFPKSLDVSKAIDKAAGAERVVVGPPPYSRGKPTQQYDDCRKTSWDCDVQPITAPASDLSAAWTGWGTALKPAHEPIVVARKPIAGTVAFNVIRHCTGAINIGKCRVETEDNLNVGAYSEVEKNPIRCGVAEQPVGRWPANIIHDGSGDVIAAFPDAPGQQADSIEDGEDQGNSVYGKMKRGGPHHKPRNEQNKCAARFFYCAKASKKDRGEGNVHPTVKPSLLMEYLCRLVTPPNGTVLDPFMGSGTTGLAAQSEGFDFIGIEKNEEYFKIAEARLNAN